MTKLDRLAELLKDAIPLPYQFDVLRHSVNEKEFPDQRGSKLSPHTVALLQSAVKLAPSMFKALSAWQAFDESLKGKRGAILGGTSFGLLQAARDAMAEMEKAKTGKREDCVCAPCEARRLVFGGNINCQEQETMRGNTAKALQYASSVLSEEDVREAALGHIQYFAYLEAMKELRK